VNSALHSNKQLISELAQEFGRQCIIASVDCKQIKGKFYIATNNGSNMTDLTLTKFLEQCSDLAIGEICINSIDRDGTGNGFQIELLDCLPELFEIPVIISGGVGNYSHLAEGLKDARVDAVATANLLNFMGDGLASARSQLVGLGIDLPIFDLHQELN
jgi:cyclase